jgi:Trk K+ transport system NAD-binding subunit
VARRVRHALYRKRHDARTIARYAFTMLREFRWTLSLLTFLVILGAALYASTPMKALGGRPSFMLSLYGAWMAFFAQGIGPTPETWYLMMMEGMYPLLGFMLIGEGIVRFGMLMVSRRRGEKEWMTVMAATYSNHVVLCGLGRLGIRVLEDLLRMNLSVVAVEKDPQCPFLEEAKSTGVPVLVQNMCDDQALLDAGIERARAVVIATNDDLANLEVALDSRRFNKDIRIAMRVFDHRLTEKLQTVFGVDAIFSQSSLAAASVAAKTFDVDVLTAFHLGDRLFVTARVSVEKLRGKTIAEIEAAHGVRVIALGSSGTPAPGAVVESGQDLVVSGEHAAIEALSSGSSTSKARMIG